MLVIIKFREFINKYLLVGIVSIEFLKVVILVDLIGIGFFLNKSIILY